jgi:hypothetical protein
METISLENVPEIIKCHGRRIGSWPNISRAKLTGSVDDPFGGKKNSYTFNNLWNKNVTFCVELNGRDAFLKTFKLSKLQPRNEIQGLNHIW